MRQPHVENLDGPFHVEQQVGGLDVAMDDPFLVRELQAPRCLQDAVDRLLDRKRSVLLHQRREVAPFDVFHHQKVHAVSFVGIVGGDDIRMPQLGGRPHLAFEARHGSRVPHRLCRQHLQSHQSIHPAMLGLEDLAHAAGAELVEDRIVAQEQGLDLAVEDLMTLERREVACADELPSQLFSVLGVGLGRNEVFEFAGGDDPALFKLLHKPFKSDGHRMFCPLLTAGSGRPGRLLLGPLTRILTPGSRPLRRTVPFDLAVGQSFLKCGY